MSRPALDHPLDGLRVAMIDTETTGIDFDAGVHAVSVAVVHLTLGRNQPEPELAFHTLVRPPVPIPPKATEIHGITDAEVADAPTWADVRAAMIPHVIGRIPAAFNAPYDFRVIEQEQTRIGRPALAWPWIDPLVLAKIVDKYEKGKSLVEVARRRGIVVDAHGAAADAMTAAIVLPWLLSEGWRAVGAKSIPRHLRNLGEYLAWQRGTALGQEIEFVRWASQKGRRDPVDCPWHRLEGVEPPQPPEATQPEASRCASCGAAIIWAVTANASRVPLDAHEHEIVAHDDVAGDPRVTGRDGKDCMYVVGYRGAELVKGYALPADVRPEVPRFKVRKSHFASCPNASNHRKAAQRGREASP
jgi:DNA polymerase-3 subunit epsilon